MKTTSQDHQSAAQDPAAKTSEKIFSQPIFAAPEEKTEEESTTLAPEIAQLTTANAELLADLQRTRADFENFRKQAEAQKSRAATTAAEATVEKFLPLLDDLERAFATYPDQLSPLQKSLDKTLKDLGLTPIPSSPGTAFNPDLHDAVMVEGDGEHETIAATLRPGYYYDGRVLRPAMVKVVKS